MVSVRRRPRALMIPSTALRHIRLGSPTSARVGIMVEITAHMLEWPAYRRAMPGERDRSTKMCPDGEPSKSMLASMTLMFALERVRRRCRNLRRTVWDCCPLGSPADVECPEGPHLQLLCLACLHARSHLSGP